jgi:hypothetical protein
MVIMLDKPITKRQLGWMAVNGGIIAVIAVFVYDRLGMSDPQGGFGPMQMLALIGAIAAILIGISLIPLGDQPT